MANFVKLLGFGALFGFLLSRSRATDFDAIANMFLLTDLHLMGVIGLAVVVAGVGLALFRRSNARGGSWPTIARKPVKPGLIVGSVLFGAGWAITGTCPGTGLAQIGEGKWIALFTVAGILVGSWLYAKVGRQFEHWLAAVRRPAPTVPAARSAEHGA
jgi:uncharacterized membrane protein YedE/YeeE